MKNMKKLWALLLALAMTFSLAACGGSTTEEDTADDQTTEEDRKSTRLNSSHKHRSRMPSSA